MDRAGLPVARPGLRVGLLGGSFDPAHRGHAHITREALKRFDLDRVWWLVTPGNPLKSAGPAPLARRMERARRVIRHPRVTVTDIEARIGTRYTAETVAALQSTYPGVRFVWLMGADNFAQLDLWDRWETIVHSLPIGVLARPGQRISARMSRAALRFRPFKISGRAARLLPSATPPAWCFVNIPMDAASSTEIRAQGDWTR